MDEEGIIKKQSIQGWTLNLNWSDKRFRQRIDTVVLK